jgi:hypothetical protein
MIYSILNVSGMYIICKHNMHRAIHEICIEKKEKYILYLLG